MRRARESFGGSGVIVLADNGRLAAQGAGHRRLARLEGIDHIHLKRGQPQHTVRQQSEELGQRGEISKKTSEHLLVRVLKKLNRQKVVEWPSPHTNSTAAETACVVRTGLVLYCQHDGDKPFFTRTMSKSLINALIFYLYLCI